MSVPVSVSVPVSLSLSRSGARVAAWTGHADTVMDVCVASDDTAVSVSLRAGLSPSRGV